MTASRAGASPPRISACGGEAIAPERPRRVRRPQRRRRAGSGRRPGAAHRQPRARLAFPNCGAPAAQADFLRGVAWLHSFGYEDAIDAFRAAQKIDPAFAMAYWGEAMSFSQPLWFFEEAEKGRAALAKLGATPDGAAGEGEDAARAGVPARGRGAVRRRRRSRRAARRSPRRWPRSPPPIPGRRRGAGVLCAGAAGTLPRGDAVAADCARRPARSPRRCSPATRSIPAPRTTSCTPTTTARWRREALAGGAGLREDRAGGEPRAPHAGARVPAARITGTRRRRATTRRGTRRWRGRRGAAAGGAARLSQPDLAAVRVDPAGTVHRRRSGAGR